MNFPNLSDVPVMLHGYRVVAVALRQEPPEYGVSKRTAVVIVHRPEHPVHEFVVATYIFGEVGWDSGFYTDSYTAALENLKQRT